MIGISYSVCGEFVDVKVHTPRGRADIVLRASGNLSVMELKLDKDVSTAVQQTELKNYPERFALCGLPVVKVGINLDSKRTIGNWIIA